MGYFCFGAPGIITFNINVLLRIANGTPCSMYPTNHTLN